MKLIKPSVEILEQGPGLQGVYDMIELCGKTSYKSEVKGGEEAKKFVDARINEGHLAVLEFGTVYLAMPITTHYSGDVCVYMNSPNYCRVTVSSGFKFVDIFGDKVDCWCITTNLRFIQENGLWNDVRELLCEPTEFHVKRYCAKFTANIHVYKDLTRHRTMSFCIESTRYCNYTSEKKFGRSIKFLSPVWLKPEETEEFSEDCKTLENIYFKWIEKHGWQPQQAAEFLCQDTAGDVCICGFPEDWSHLFDLRYRGTTGKPHPEVLNVATMLHKEFENRGINL